MIRTINRRLFSSATFRDQRLAELRALHDSAPERRVAASNFRSTTTIDALKRDVRDGTVEAGAAVAVIGRVLRRRSFGSKLYFIDLGALHACAEVQRDDAPAELRERFEVQVMARAGDPCDESDRAVHRVLRRGDVVGVSGVWGATKNGTPALRDLAETHLLAPCLHDWPTELKDADWRARARHVDLLTNAHSARTLRLRSDVVRRIREQLHELGFVEVETPIVGERGGGALARPMCTRVDDLHRDLFLRTAPELHLKQLVVGGFERVFELGKQFRNESVDATHQPEFTTCEAYSVGWRYEEMMAMTEQLLSSVAALSDKGEMLRRTPYARVAFDCALSERLGGEDVTHMDVGALQRAHTERKLPLPPVRTRGKLLDSLFAHLVEPEIDTPTFVTDHPLELSPLARAHEDDARRHLAQRFELFVPSASGRAIELVNAYTEQNDAGEQRRAFERQQRDRALGDTEVAEMDDDFVRVLEYGLPPCAGWGLGVDRLVMLLSGSTTIKDVVLFPMIRAAQR